MDVVCWRTGIPLGEARASQIVSWHWRRIAANKPKLRCHRSNLFRNILYHSIVVLDNSIRKDSFRKGEASLHRSFCFFCFALPRNTTQIPTGLTRSRLRFELSCIEGCVRTSRHSPLHRETWCGNPSSNVRVPIPHRSLTF